MDKFATLEPVRLYNARNAPAEPKIGRFGARIFRTILDHLPIPDWPAFARCSRATAAIVRDDAVWARKWAALGIDAHTELASAVELLEKGTKPKAPQPVPDDDFGDFTAADPAAPSNFGTPFPVMPSLSFAPVIHQNASKANYMRLHRLLKPILRILSSPPHLVLPQIAEATSPALIHQATTLRILSLFLSPSIRPVRQWKQLYLSLRSAMDRFESTLLAAFDLADSQGNEAAMKEAAESSWNVRDSSTSDWEMGKVWVEKREIFYQQSEWQALDNFTTEDALDFDAMDRFMDHVLAALHDHGSRAVRVFPPESQVLVLFSERLSNEVVGDYITTLLTHAREISLNTYLTSTAASFKEAWRIVDALLSIAAGRKDSILTQSQAEDIVFRMFEPNMDEYLDEEVEHVKSVFDRIIKRWNQTATSSTQSDAAFLHSQNPALVKRNVLTSFTNLLLLPVTLVPRTVGAVGGALITGGTAAVQGITMLNPQRWASRATLEDTPPLSDPVPAPVDVDKGTEASDAPVPQQLDTLLSLDVALELIHADREALKRLEVFSGYPGHCGQRVQDTIEEIFILILQALGNQHISPGFEQAIAKMKAYKPAEHTEISKVAPLVHFFELVHIGDMIQSMIQVYFDKEIAVHIDKTDFLNTAVREKKRFENTLDDLVAGGLNAGTDTLMTQVEHIIITLTKPREYYPSENDPLDLGPTDGCLTAIQCLEAHCKLLKGSTSKEVLEVFYQEIGMRLLVILQKHIKRHIISLNGGFQIISDLNAYNTFINTFKIPTLNSEFAHLKMLGHVYIVEDAKDLAQIVRDVARYGGAYKPEDIYEFIQRRSDWKQIEKTVDKTMYSLSFKEDCIIS